MKHIVCLTKTYNLDDFKLWYNYHSSLGYVIHIIDNESICNIQTLLKTKDTYTRLTGWPNQWELYNEICRNNWYNFMDGDFVAFIDDDEYIWYYLDYYKIIEKDDPKYMGKNYESIEEYLEKQMTEYKLDCVIMPQILMSTSEFKKDRKENLIDFSRYTRNDMTSQGKVFIKYKAINNYDFSFDKVETGHVPYINGIRKSIVNACGTTDSTYGGVDRTACLRLFHYHIKSEYDWNLKYLRGSAAVDHQWYDKDIINNKNFGGYIIKDDTMYEMKKVMKL